MDIPADVVKKRNDIKQRLYYMFKGKVDLEIVDFVLAECKYEGICNVCIILYVWYETWKFLSLKFLLLYIYSSCMIA